MAKLPAMAAIDPTLVAADAALEAKENASKPRRYLGMSGIGHACERSLWYGFHWYSEPAFNASTLRKFADGHLGEDVQADRLKMVDGVTLYTHQDDGEQFGYSDLAGHFKGHIDGVITGLLQAPKTPHIWEHKQTAESKFKTLGKLKEKHGEKQAFAQWDETYYAQGVLYMHYSGLTRHYLTVSTPGGRESTSCRSDADPKHAAALIEKARRIIKADQPPTKHSNDATNFVCKHFCSHSDVCHAGAAPLVNCRSCYFAKPVDTGDGAWRCNKFNQNLPLEQQRKGCRDWQAIDMADARPPMNWGKA